MGMFGMMGKVEMAFFAGNVSIVCDGSFNRSSMFVFYNDSIAIFSNFVIFDDTAIQFRIATRQRRLTQVHFDVDIKALGVHFP